MSGNLSVAERYKDYLLMRLWGQALDIDGDLMLCCVVEGVFHKGAFLFSRSAASSPPCPHLLAELETQEAGHFLSHVYVRACLRDS